MFHVLGFTSPLQSDFLSCIDRNASAIQALAEQGVQLEVAMDGYGLEVQQASLAVMAWQSNMDALHMNPRSPSS